MNIDYARVGGPPKAWRHCIVYLDDAEIKDVIEANAVEGWVRHYVRDELGQFAQEQNLCPKIETLKGTVRIECPKDKA